MNYWQEFSGRPIPADDGPLSAKIVVAGKSDRRLQPVRVAYTIPVPRGRRRPSRRSRPADPAASYEIVSPGDRRARPAVVKVTKDDFFGPLVKNYVFNFVPDTTLRSLRVNGRCWRLQAGRAELQRPVHGRPDAVADGQGRRRRSRRDRRRRTRRPAPPGRPRSPSPTAARRRSTRSTSTRPSRGSDEFDRRLGPQWQLLRPDDSSARVAGRLAGHHLAERRPAGQHQHRQEPRTAGRQRRLDGRVQARLLPPLANNNEQGGIIAYADDQNYVKLAWEMASSTQAINKLRVVRLREQNGTATTLQVTGDDAQSIVGADGAIWLRLAKTRQRLQGLLLQRRQRVAVLRRDDAQRRADEGRPGRVQPRRDLDRPRRRVRLLPHRQRRATRCRARSPSRRRASAHGARDAGADARRAGDFGPFTPGVDRTYTASTTANVICTAGDATLTCRPRPADQRAVLPCRSRCR